MQVVRLPSLRSRIASWRAQHGLEPLPPLDPAPAEVQAAGPWVARLLLDLRCGDAYHRGLAAGVLNDLLITWGPQPTPAQVAIMEVRAPPPPPMTVCSRVQPFSVGRCRGCVAPPMQGMSPGRQHTHAHTTPTPPHPTPFLPASQAVLLDLVWLLRQGDPFGSGVAAAALSQVWAGPVACAPTPQCWAAGRHPGPAGLFPCLPRQ